MSRVMIDCTGANAVDVHDKLPDTAIVGCYITGTSNIIWSDEEKDLWSSHADLITIDQGYQSPALTTAVVRDVETDAWAAAKAVDRNTWDPAVVRPTIYCDQTDLVTVLAAGWHGNLWLAIEGWAEGDALPNVGPCTVVAVQNAQNIEDLYDSSIVLDQWWPNKETDVTTDQTGWKHCSKCQALFWGAKQTESSCPRGGAHDDTGSYTYTLTAEE